MKNKFLAALLSMAMLVSTMSLPVLATDTTSADSTDQNITTEYTTEIEEAQEAADQGAVLSDDPEDLTDDPGNGRLEGDIPSDFYDTESDEASLRLQASTVITHDERFKGCTKEKGIDVSYHNKTIDWEKVKADGYTFAIIRVCYRGYESGTLAYDTMYKKNIEGALAAGVKVGVYVFSQAITEQEAEQEADFILAGISGYKITLPVVFDYEYFNGGRFSSASSPNLGDRTRTDICLAFIKKVKAAGYTPMVYANKSMLTNDLYASELSAKCPIWLARYNNYAGYDGDYEYWQFSSTGSVDGISGNVDVNFHYISSVPTLQGSSSRVEKISLSWNQIDKVTGYKLQRYNYAQKKYETLKIISSNATTSYTDTGLKAGTTYAYRIRTYTKKSTGTVYGDYCSAKKITTKSSVFGRINVASINIRSGASASKSLVTKAKRNTAVKVVGATGEWYKVHISVKGKTKKGYLKSKYVTMLGTPAIDSGITSTSAVKLTWTKVSSANGYKVQRLNPATNKYSTIATITSPTTLSYKDSSLKGKTAYSYRIIAYKNVNGAKIYGNYSTAMSFTTK